jgi:hypothetical protein
MLNFVSEKKANTMLRSMLGSFELGVDHSGMLANGLHELLFCFLRIPIVLRHDIACPTSLLPFERSFRASVAACALRSSSIPAIPLGKTPAAWFVLCGLRSLTIVLASVSPARHWSGSLSCSPILFFLFHSGDSRFELLLLNSCELCPFFFSSCWSSLVSQHHVPPWAH